MPTPLFSSSIPCYNQGKYLTDAIHSILRQEGARCEIIVVDDGSTDNTAHVAAAFGDRLHYLHKPNAGLSAARNTDVLHSSGDLLLFLDSDDHLLPGMLAAMTRAITAEPQAVLYYGVCHYVNETGERLHTQDLPDYSEEAFHRLLGNQMPCHTVVVRRTVLANTGLFEPRLKSCEDWDLWLRVAAQGGRFVRVAGAEVAYRQYEGSMSKKPMRMLQAALAVLARSRIHHVDCPVCRQLIAQSIHSHSEIFFDQLYDSTVRNNPAHNRLSGWWLMLRTVRDNPTLARVVAKRIKRKFAGRK